MKSAFADACGLVEEVLTGDTRQSIVAEAAASGVFATALAHLRDGMRADAFRAGRRGFSFKRFVAAFDRATRDEGLHALHDWDGLADRINADSIPVDVLTFIIGQRASNPVDTRVLAIALDYYLMYILALLAMRAWDGDDPDGNLDRVGALLGLLQGPGGSGQRFSDDAETLLLIATSHFEIDETGYDRLLVRVRTLDEAHRLRVAMGHAHCMGGHLRFGFEATYARDTASMRNDNRADYPWLCFALTALMRAYARLADAGSSGLERDRIVEGLINGLTADAGAFAAAPPDALSAVREEWDEFHALFHAIARRWRPTPSAPARRIGLLADRAVLQLLAEPAERRDGRRHAVGRAVAAEPQRPAHRRAARRCRRGQERIRLATTLMGYARSNPDPIRGRLMPAIVYDPQTGHRAFAETLRALQGR